MVAAKSLGVGVLFAASLGSLTASAGEIISAGSGARLFVERRMGPAEAGISSSESGSYVQAGWGARPAPVPSQGVAPVPVALFVPPSPQTIAPPPPPAPREVTPAASYDAFVNFGTAPYAGQGTLASGEARPWFTSDSVTKAYGGAPSAQQVQDFSKTVLDRVASTFEKSGLTVNLTSDPNASAPHMLSVASGLSSTSNPNAVGISSVGRDGFSFIDKLGYAKSADELMWAVAHNVAHELMHAFGAGHYDEPGGKNLDAPMANWALLTDPEARFGSAAIAEMTRNLRQGGLASRYGISLQEMGQEWDASSVQYQTLGAHGLPVPEPATLALWGTMAGLGCVLRARSRKSA